MADELTDTATQYNIVFTMATATIKTALAIHSHMGMTIDHCVSYCKGQKVRVQCSRHIYHTHRGKEYRKGFVWKPCHI